MVVSCSLRVWWYDVLLLRVLVDDCRYGSGESVTFFDCCV
jgi:hypothetical protein